MNIQTSIKLPRRASSYRIPEDLDLQLQYPKDRIPEDLDLQLQYPKDRRSINFKFLSCIREIKLYLNSIRLKLK